MIYFTVIVHHVFIVLSQIRYILLVLERILISLNFVTVCVMYLFTKLQQDNETANAFVTLPYKILTFTHLHTPHTPAKNTRGRRENASNQYFPLFPQVFVTLLFWRYMYMFLAPLAKAYVMARYLS